MFRNNLPFINFKSSVCDIQYFINVNGLLSRLLEAQNLILSYDMKHEL